LENFVIHPKSQGRELPSDHAPNNEVNKEVIISSIMFALNENYKRKLKLTRLVCKFTIFQKDQKQNQNP